MLVGKPFDRPTIYKAAFVFEQADDWKAMQRAGWQLIQYLKIVR